MDPVFTTNELEITRLEGLYIKERNPPASVQGISLNGVGVCGVCVRGPVNKVIEVSSEARFLEIFGGRDHGSGGSIVGNVWKALLNKPFGKLAVVRVAAAAAVAASYNAETVDGGAGVEVLKIEASNPGTWGNNVGVKVVDATNGDANYFDLLIRYLGNVTRYKNLTIFGSTDNTLEVIGDDDGNLIKLTKLTGGRPLTHTGSGVPDGADADGYVLLGQTIAGYTTVAGSDGSVAASDYTATGGPMEKLTGYKGLGILFVAEPASAHYGSIKSKVAIEAPKAADRIWLMGANDETIAVSAAKTDVAGFRSDRIIYAYNHAYTLDPETATNVLTRPEAWVASIMSQTDVDIHPGEEDTKVFTAGIRALYNEALVREDYVTLKEAGIAAFEKDTDGGKVIVSGVTTSLVPGKEQITRRRMADYIQLGIAGFLKHSVKKKNLATRRNANKAAVSAWLRDLAKAERVVDTNESGVPQFLVDTEKLNTPAQRALGVERMFVQVKLIGHMLHLVLETEIGTGVVVEVQ